MSHDQLVCIHHKSVLCSRVCPRAILMFLLIYGLLNSPKDSITSQPYFILYIFTFRKAFWSKRDCFLHVQSRLDKCCRYAAVCRDLLPHEWKALPASSFSLSRTSLSFPFQYFFSFLPLQKKSDTPHAATHLFPIAQLGIDLNHG